MLSCKIVTIKTTANQYQLITTMGALPPLADPIIFKYLISTNNQGRCVMSAIFAAKLVRDSCKTITHLPKHKNEYSLPQRVWMWVKKYFFTFTQSLLWLANHFELPVFKTTNRRLRYIYSHWEPCECYRYNRCLQLSSGSCGARTVLYLSSHMLTLVDRCTGYVIGYVIGLFTYHTWDICQTSWYQVSLQE